MAHYLVTRANALLLGVMMVILLLVSGATWERLIAARSSRQWSQHTYVVLATLKDLDLALRNAEMGERGYLLTGQESYLEPYEDALGRVSNLQGELQRLTADNEVQTGRLRVLSAAIQHKLQELAETIQLRRTMGLEAALRIMGADVARATMKQIEAMLTAMTEQENNLLAERLALTESRGTWVRALIAAGTIIAIAALSLAGWMLNRAWARSRKAELDEHAIAFQLRASLDSLSQGVAVFDQNRRLTNWNDCFGAILGLPSAMIRQGTPYAAFVEYLQVDGVSCFETEDQIHHGRHVPGEPITYERVLSPGDKHLEIRRTSMPGEGFVLTVSDMTQRAKSENILRQAQKMQAIGHLTGGIAHDFNNLLTVVLGNLEFARAKLGSSEETVGAYLDRATWAAQRGATLTSQLLAFARKQPLASAPLDLSVAMPEMIALLRRTLGEHIDVRYVESAGLWPAMADGAQLENAVLNLALNARDAMPDGGRLTVEVANKVLDEEYARQQAEVTPGDYTMLAVSDTGCGMTPEVMSRVFEPFFTTKPEGKGTGLGLAMVFGFAKQSGGHVKVYSEPGEGTTVRLYLPRAVSTGAKLVQRSGIPIDIPRGSATILVVEDDAAVREIAVAILRDLGYRVLEAVDFDDGLRIFGEHVAAVDLLLTDVVLPGQLRGRELADHIKAVRPGVKILYMSGYTENSIVHNGRLDDGVQLISKPFKREQLARKIAEILGSSATARLSSG